MSSRAVVSVAVLVLGAFRIFAELSETPGPPVYHSAIHYYEDPLNDPVALLNRKLDQGQSELKYEGPSGYLRSVLAELGVPIASQIAVFSKTSLQAPRIHPGNPRTVFFNDSVAVAWMGGGFIELAAQDPQQGTKFYTLDQRMPEHPRFARGNDCLRCHINDATLGVPGLVEASVFTASDGSPIQSLGGTMVDHRTPLQERWGGWYVTGSSKAIRHRGNATLDPQGDPKSMVSPATLSVETLERKFDTNAYLSPHSDVAALLVFDHQMHMSNLITRLGWDFRAALLDKDPGLNRTLGNSAQEFVDYLLFVQEAPIGGAISSNSEFSLAFAARGPRDKKGRSLRDLDLQNRLQRYPCSYMIYSDAFEALPSQVKDAIYKRMWQVLSGRAQEKQYVRLTISDRRAIVEILRDTKKGLPDYFQPLK